MFYTDGTIRQWFKDCVRTILERRNTVTGVLYKDEPAILELLRVNLTGTFLAIRHALPHLLAAGGGSIVTIGSVASLVAGGWASCGRGAVT